MSSDQLAGGQSEAALRNAAEAGASNLGFLLRRQGKDWEAAQWYRRAAEAGNDVAARNLAVLLGEYGDTRGADEWHRRASAMAAGNEPLPGGAEPFTPRGHQDRPPAGPQAPAPAGQRRPRPALWPPRPR